MHEDDLRLAVATNAQRYFLALGNAPVCGTVPVGPARRGHEAPLLASGVSSELIESITTGLRMVGWTIDRVVPAQAAWVSFVTRRHRRARRGTISIGVRLAREIHIIEVEAGSISCVRRLRIADDCLPAEAAHPWYVVGTGGSDASAATVAASAATLSRRFEIIPNATRRARIARERRISRAFVAIACVNILVAAMAYRWRLERQLTQVGARRSAIREAASRAIALRDSAGRLVERITAMSELERSAPRWSAVLSRIVVALPADAVLTSIRAESDSVTVDGEATDASSVISPLRRAPGIGSARSTSLLSRELSVDQSGPERWRVAVHVDHAAATRR
jgi:hypothetical protein